MEAFRFEPGQIWSLEEILRVGEGKVGVSYWRLVRSQDALCFELEQVSYYESQVRPLVTPMCLVCGFIEKACTCAPSVRRIQRGAMKIIDRAAMLSGKPWLLVEGGLEAGRHEGCVSDCHLLSEGTRYRHSVRCRGLSYRAPVYADKPLLEAGRFDWLAKRMDAGLCRALTEEQLRCSWALQGDLEQGYRLGALERIQAIAVATGTFGLGLYMLVELRDVIMRSRTAVISGQVTLLSNVVAQAMAPSLSSMTPKELRPYWRTLLSILEEEYARALQELGIPQGEGA